MLLGDLAKESGFELFGDSTTIIKGIRDISCPESGFLSFAYKIKDQNFEAFDEGIIWVLEKPHKAAKNGLIAKNFKQALYTILSIFEDLQRRDEQGISSNADISQDSQIAEGVFIDSFVKIAADSQIAKNVVLHSNVYIGKSCSVGEGSVLFPGVVLADKVKIGANCILHPGVVVGGDGLGFYREKDRWHKIPHLGGVCIGDNVEIGSNSSIDRGVLGDTIIESGVKIDSLVHIAHNVELGSGTIVAALSGISGSTKIGRRVIIGGQVGVADHVNVADDTFVLSRSGITKNITKSGQRISGFPAQDHLQEIKEKVNLRKILRKKN